MGGGEYITSLLLPLDTSFVAAISHLNVALCSHQPPDGLAGASIPELDHRAVRGASDHGAGGVVRHGVYELLLCRDNGHVPIAPATRKRQRRVRSDRCVLAVTNVNFAGQTEASERRANQDAKEELFMQRGAKRGAYWSRRSARMLLASLLAVPAPGSVLSSSLCSSRLLTSTDKWPDPHLQSE